MMEWDTFVEFNKIMLLIFVIVFVASVIVSYLYGKYKSKGDKNET